MSLRKPLRFGLFLYDLLRFAAIVGAVVQNGPSPDGGFSSSSVLPMLAFASPNALFAFLALFLWADPERHERYVPLYVAGKAVFAAAALLWIFFSADRVLGVLGLGDPAAAGSIVLSLLLIPADLVSILAARLLRIRTGGGVQVPAAAEPEREPDPADLAESVAP